MSALCIVAAAVYWVIGVLVMTVDAKRLSPGPVDPEEVVLNAPILWILWPFIALCLWLDRHNPT
jgi:hypothetical protein